MRCGFCGSHLHTERLCPKTWAGSARRANLRCSYCGGPDHDDSACVKRWRGPLTEQDADHFVLDKP